MKPIFKVLTVSLLLPSAISTLADVHYVDVNCTNATLPYTSWSTAATNIQDAVDEAVAGDEIVATNGIYATGGRTTVADSTTNRVAVDKPLTVRSVNGPQFTAIDGGASVRCVYLTNRASLCGFTLTNGRAPQGGGLWCESADAGVSNCVVSGNSSFGRIRFLNVGYACCNQYQTFAGGVYGGTLYDCTLSDNWAETYSFLGFRCDLSTCTATGDGHIQTYYSFGAGGGAANATLNNCTLTGNWADSGGGAYGCTLNNCTLTGNSGGAYYSRLNNCIAYFNTVANYYSCTLNYSCTTPLPTNGVGNITNDPAFVNPAAGNYRLRPDSPCIDAGTNLSATITNDLDGRPRPLDGNGDGLAAFDMGAYEYRTPLLVWQDSRNPSPPYSSWTTAATNIQDAVDAAVAGDEIVVTNGIYAVGGRTTVADATTNRVAVDKPLTVRSVNGALSTTISGGGSVRCVYLTSDSSLSGFTLTDGWALRGAGLWCESTNAVVSNCVVLGNSAPIYGDLYDSFGGGTYGGTLNNCILKNNRIGGYRASETLHAGGGAFSATLNNCTLSGNSADSGGGASGCTLNNCTLTDNAALWPGGGASGCTLNNCTLAGNWARSGGGADSCTLNNCTLTGNSAGDSSNGWGGGASGCTLNNCTLTGNSVIGWNGCYGGGASGCTLNNCTLAGNSAYVGDNSWGGGASECTLNNSSLSGNQAKHGGGADGCTLNNCIVYFNTALDGANHEASTLIYSCTAPQPTNGVGNITNAPLFMDQASGNLRLQSNSPCINAGLNAFAAAGPDLDGKQRIVGYTVDMGAYEFQSAPSIAPQMSIASTGTNVILAWPTDYAGIFIQGDHYEAYFLYSTTNLVSPVVWRFVYPMPVVVNGQLVVTNTIDGTQRFYRIVRVTGPLSDVPCLWSGPNPCPCSTRCSSNLHWVEYANCRFCD